MNNRRDVRQSEVAHWCTAAFGHNHATSLKQRGIRLLEEAVEAYQAVDGDPAMAHKLVDFIFARPKGTISQELGGVGITLLALAQAAGVSADDAEKSEFSRILAIPLEHFAKRNKEKNAAGFNHDPEDGKSFAGVIERDERALAEELTATDTLDEVTADRDFWKAEASRLAAQALPNVEALQGSQALVLYFRTAEDRDFMVAAVKEAHPGMRALAV